MIPIARFLIAGLLACMPLAASANPIATTRSTAGNSYLSGGEVKISEPVAADLYAAGGNVIVAQSVANDATLAGGTVDVQAAIGQDLRATGGKVSINANIGGDLVAAGGNVSIGKGTRIGGDVLLAGGEVQFGGQALGHAKLAGGKVTVSGEIKGDASLYAHELRLEPGARILGNLTYASGTPLSTQELALVAGKVTREEGSRNWRQASRVSWFHPAFFVSMLICGSFLFLVFPNAVSGTQQTMRQSPVRSLLLGVALLFALPPVALLFMVTVIGIPIGFGLLMLYPLLLMLGYLGAAFFIGRRTADAMRQSDKAGRGRQIGFLAIALALLALAANIPFLGGMLVFLAMLTGMGGWVQWLYRRYRASRPSAEVQL
jgi:hypothetical protein